MLLKKTNIKERLDRYRDKVYKEKDILEEVKAIFEEDRFRESEILNTLETPNKTNSNAFNIDLLDHKRIYHLNQIKKICVDYRLRFLDSKYFKGNYPQGALDEIKFLENKNQTRLEGFKIVAPSKLFVLKKADDPLLFAPMGNGYFYLIHKWGNDLHPLRKWLMWPSKNFENTVFTVFLMSVLVTLLVPDGLFTKNQTVSQGIMVFFFMFKSIAAVVIFYAFALGKNFNTAIWNSKYDKT